MSVHLAGLTLPNPVLVASGCGGTGRELDGFGAFEGLGGFVTRSITVGAGRRRLAAHRGDAVRPGQRGRPAEPGIDHFLATELPWLAQRQVAVLVSIVGRSLGEYAELARRLGRSPGVAGIEVNLSAPDAPGTQVFDVREPFHAASVVAAVRRDLPRDIPILAKIRSDVVRVVESARTVLDAGAGAVVVGNALPASMPDGRPGGLSGPAIRPLVLRCVVEVHAEVPEAQIVAAGGVADARDARAYLDAGATAVQVGTALLHDPTTATRLVADLGEDR
jgi:dihydroorotate dehydrogenase (NAD+) catalytic subunit